MARGPPGAETVAPWWRVSDGAAFDVVLNSVSDRVIPFRGEVITDSVFHTIDKDLIGFPPILDDGSAVEAERAHNVKSVGISKVGRYEGDEFGNVLVTGEPCKVTNSGADGSAGSSHLFDVLGKEAVPNLLEVAKREVNVETSVERREGPECAV